MRVEFLKDTEPYTTGDVIEVAEDRAQDLIRQGLAREVDDKTEVKIQSEEKAKEPTEDKAVGSGSVENKSV